MGTAVGTFSGRSNHRIRLETQLASQNVAGDYSTLNWQLYAERTSTSSTYYLTAAGGGSVNIGGNVIGVPGIAYDFRSTATYLIASGSVNVGHNADGTLTYGFSASYSLGGTIGSASCSSSETLPTIARATQPTVTPGSGDTGVAYSIGMNAASSAFAHDLFYSLDGGTTYTQIGTDIPASTTSQSWTPASTLLPNSSSVTAIILLRTKSGVGGSIIGDKTVSLPLTVPVAVVPVISNVTFTDSQTSGPDIPTLMGGAGRFVQGWSKLVPTVTSSGASGSTVTSSAVTMNGQVAASGAAFGLPVNLSGAVPFSAVVGDSRGRSSSPYIQTIPVTAYNFPNLPTPLVARTSDAAGAIPSPTGTYLAITPAASVSDLTFGGVQKNLLEYQIRTMPAGGSWTTVQAWTAVGVSGNTWTTKKVLAGYASNTQWVVEVSVRDLFGKNGYSPANTVKVLAIIVPSESVAFDWDGANGIGIGKYRTQGMLDVFGQVYQNNGLAVLDTGDSASTADIAAGTRTDEFISPAGLAVQRALDQLVARNRNRVRNGSFRCNQRGILTGTGVGSGLFGFDGWETTSPLANGFTNGSNENATTGLNWAAGGCSMDATDTSWAAVGTHCINLYSPTIADSCVSLDGEFGSLKYGMQVGHTYTVSATGNVKVAMTGTSVATDTDGNTGTAMPRERAIVVHCQLSTGGYTIFHSTQVPNVVGSATRVSVTLTVPANTIATSVRFYLGNTVGQIRWDAARITETGIAPSGALADTVYVDGATSGAFWNGVANNSTTTWGAAYTFTAAPQGQSITVGLYHRMAQRIERCDLPAGAYVLSWSGTAKARMWKPGTVEASKPAWASGPITATLDGLTDWIIEFNNGTVGQVQFESGSVPSPYELIPYTEELLRCQRYYYQINSITSGMRLSQAGFQVTTSESEVFFIMPVTMRATPSINFSSCWWTDGYSFNIAIVGASLVNGASDSRNVNAYITWSGAAGAVARPGTVSGQVAGSYVGFDSELRAEAA